MGPNLFGKLVENPLGPKPLLEIILLCNRQTGLSILLMRTALHLCRPFFPELNHKKTGILVEFVVFLRHLGKSQLKVELGRLPCLPWPRSLLLSRPTMFKDMNLVFIHFYFSSSAPVGSMSQVSLSGLGPSPSAPFL